MVGAGHRGPRGGGRISEWDGLGLHLGRRRHGRPRGAATWNNRRNLQRAIARPATDTRLPSPYLRSAPLRSGVATSDLAARFATKGPDKFAGVEAELCDGLPRLRDAGVWLACDVYEFVDGGDHVIVIGGVSWIDSVSFRPLLYHRRSFAALGSSFGSSG